MVATAPGEKLLMAPPCEEFDPPYGIKVVFCAENYILFVGKSTKTAVTRAAFF